MTPDLTPTPYPHVPEETKNFAKSGENGTFGDIDPNDHLAKALSGARWSQAPETLHLDRKTLCHDND
jgi:hypothetical protein